MFFFYKPSYFQKAFHSTVLYLYLLTPTKERKLNTNIVKMSTQQNATFLPDFYANLEDQ